MAIHLVDVEITRVTGIHLLGTMTVCTKNYFSPSHIGLNATKRQKKSIFFTVKSVLGTATKLYHIRVQTAGLSVG